MTAVAPAAPELPSFAFLPSTVANIVMLGPPPSKDTCQSNINKLFAPGYKDTTENVVEMPVPPQSKDTCQSNINQLFAPGCGDTAEKHSAIDRAEPPPKRQTADEIEADAKWHRRGISQMNSK